MSSRFTAIKESQNRNAIAIQENGRRSDLFGVNVFNEKKNAFKAFCFLSRIGVKEMSTAGPPFSPFLALPFPLRTPGLLIPLWPQNL